METSPLVRDAIRPLVQHRKEQMLISHTDLIELPTPDPRPPLPISPDPEPGRHIWSWFCPLQWKQPLKNGWFWIMVLALIAAVVAPITVHFAGTAKPPK